MIYDTLQYKDILRKKRGNKKQFNRKNVLRKKNNLRATKISGENGFTEANNFVPGMFTWVPSLHELNRIFTILARHASSKTSVSVGQL